MNKKNGFTLVELLAVIVILAVILVIAVPQIINVINESKKGVLESSARLIASSAETMKISNDTLGINSEIRCEDVANISSEDYDTCKIDFINGKAHVSLVGKGKFEGMGVLLGTKDNVIATYGLEEDDTAEHNIRYVGSNPTNYVEFGNDGELWRIIGVFNMTTAEGKKEKLMKIVRNSSIGKYSWDSSDSGVNDGYGVNQWGESTYIDGTSYEGADLMRELNTLYLNSESGYCYNESNNAYTTCNFTNAGIKDTYRGMIEEVVWNTAGFWDYSSQSAYNKERGEGSGQICKGTTNEGGKYCTDIVNRIVMWTGKVALIYPSDYGYASTNTSCRRTMVNINGYSCHNNNWLHTGLSYWALSSIATSGYSNLSWHIAWPGYAGDISSHKDLEVMPSLYLKSNVYIASGEGTQASPYKLSIN